MEFMQTFFVIFEQLKCGWGLNSIEALVILKTSISQSQYHSLLKLKNNILVNAYLTCAFLFSS